MTETLIHVRTAARTLNCTDTHVYNMIRDGRVKAIRIGTTGLRVVKESLEQFINDNRVNPEDYYV